MRFEGRIDHLGGFPAITEERPDLRLAEDGVNKLTVADLLGGEKWEKAICEG